jgi:hypothetical protein
MLNVCIIKATLLDILQYVSKQYHISINFNIHEQCSLMLSMCRVGDLLGHITGTLQYSLIQCINWVYRDNLLCLVDLKYVHSVARQSRVPSLFYILAVFSC